MAVRYTFFAFWVFFFLSFNLNAQCSGDCDCNLSSTVRADNGGTYNWSDPDTWNCGGGDGDRVPGPTDHVCLNMNNTAPGSETTVTLIMTQNVNVGTVEVCRKTGQNANSITVQGDFTLNINGNLSVQQNATFLIGGSLDVRVTGDLIAANNGNVTLIETAPDGGTLLVDGCYQPGNSPPSNTIDDQGGTLFWCLLCDGEPVGGAASSGGNDCNFLLPVTLIAFDVQNADRFVQVNWQTASEQNNAYFAVQRSPDGRQFQAIGQVQGHGTVHTPKQYQWTDEQPLTGNAYYRLEQVDHDGKTHFSTVRHIVRHPEPQHISISPHPIEGTLNLYLSPRLQGQRLQLSLKNQLGEEVTHREIFVPIDGQIKWKGFGAFSGLYILTIQHPMWVIRQKLLFRD